jgi:hypothetical protein
MSRSFSWSLLLVCPFKFEVRLRSPLPSQYVRRGPLKNLGNPLRFLGIAPVFAAQRVLQSVARAMHFIGSASV